MLKRQHKRQSYVCQCKLTDGRSCGQGFRNRSGLTQHVNAKHRIFTAINPNPDRQTVINDNHGDDDLMASWPAGSEGTDCGQQDTVKSTIEKHPLLDGILTLHYHYEYSHQSKESHVIPLVKLSLPAHHHLSPIKHHLLIHFGIVWILSLLSSFTHGIRHQQSRLMH